MPSFRPTTLDEVTIVCEAGRFDVPTELACTDAVEAALGVADPGSDALVRAMVGWQRLCVDAPCPTPDPSTVEVLLMLRAGGATSVLVHLESDGRLRTDTPSQIGQSDLPPLPPYEAPPTGTYDLEAPLPAEVSERPSAPLCGEEQAGLAGPFNGAARECFLGAVLAESTAEMLSARSDVEGAPFLEVWRFDGRGPLLVYLRRPDGVWARLECVLLDLGDAPEVITHTECRETTLD